MTPLAFLLCWRNASRRSSSDEMGKFSPSLCQIYKIKIRPHQDSETKLLCKFLRKEIVRAARQRHMLISCIPSKKSKTKVNCLALYPWDWTWRQKPRCTRSGMLRHKAVAKVSLDEISSLCVVHLWELGHITRTHNIGCKFMHGLHHNIT
jgi:hypothetical protein